jgi:hypothetical protein
MFELDAHEEAATQAVVELLRVDDVAALGCKVSVQISVTNASGE